MHPGYAKDKLVNSMRIGADIIKQLEDLPAPETTEKREGYIHPYSITGNVEETIIKILLRDFEQEGIRGKTDILEKIRSRTCNKYPGSRIELEVREAYRNMREILDSEPRVIEYALEAVRRSGLTPRLQIIRGGTDGARLSFMGLPTPNIFTGGHNFHSKQEWISIQHMEKTVETLINLVAVWTEKG